MNANMPERIRAAHLELRVTAVTVTYGSRRHLLMQTLSSVMSEGVARVVIVNNNAAWDVQRLSTEAGPCAVQVVNMSENGGAAAGFAVGISRALECDSELIWLLDDDNRPVHGALRILLSCYLQLRRGTASDKLAVLGFREERQFEVVRGGNLRYVNPRRSSFRGFHIVDVPHKLWSRTPWTARNPNQPLPRTVDLDVASFGGMLFHRAVIRAVGLPRRDLVLYEDDTEFSYRITNSGGRIVLVTEARIDDIEAPWNGKRLFGNSFLGLLCGQGDFRAYYGMRNGTFFDVHCRSHDRLMLWINRRVYMAVLWLFSFALGRRERYKLIVTAIADGMQKRLGMNARFPL